jgi:hypothetical protein
MGTLATFFNRTNFIPVAARSATKGKTWQQSETRVHQKIDAKVDAKIDAKSAVNPYKLRGLPNDDVYFYCKRIDNSRLVRQADPEAKGQCWSAIGAACVVAVLFGSVMAPRVGTILAGYKVQQLKQEHRALVEERRTLDVEEAHMLSPIRLNELASKSRLASPGVGQIVRLQPNGDGTFASVVNRSALKSR